MNDSGLSNEQLDEIILAVSGTALEVEVVLEQLGIEADATDVESDLETRNMERCQGCGWWFESCMLDGGDAGEHPGYCDDCRRERWPEEFDEN